MTERFKNNKCTAENPNEAIAFLGNADSNLKIIEEELDVSIITRGESVNVSGDEEKVELVSQILDSLFL